MLDYKALGTGILVASAVFLIKERKKIKTFISAIVNKSGNEKMSDKLQDIMKDGATYEEAKKILFTNELIKALRIDIPCWEVNKNLTLVQGCKVSFVDKEIGFIQGDFLGLIKPDLVGYDYLYVLRNTKTSIIRHAPISYVEEDTINVY